MSFSIIIHMAWNFFPLYFNVTLARVFGCLDYLQFHTLGTNKNLILGFAGEAWQLSGVRWSKEENRVRTVHSPGSGEGYHQVYSGMAQGQGSWRFLLIIQEHRQCFGFLVELEVSSG